MRDLVQRTGVNASTLRAWETRHGLIQPQRTPSGHRLYSQLDVERVRRLQALLAQGLSLAEIAPLLDGAELEEAEVTAAASREVAGSGWQGYLAEMLLALEVFSTERLDQLYNEACALYPIDIVTMKLLVPVLEQLGERWDKRPAGIAEEHFFSAWLRNKLGARLHHRAAAARGRLLILACLPDENHEIGLLLFALSALQRGYGVVYLGANMPIRGIAPIAQRTHAAAIVLAGRAVSGTEALLGEIAWLVQSTPAPVLVGSHFSVQAGEALQARGAIPLGIDLAYGVHQLERRIPPIGRGRVRSSME